MAWEDATRTHIQLLMDQGKWKEAYSCLLAYIEKNGEDYWAKNTKALIECKI